ncbi:MAG: Do family serine endopeptidase [Hyphomicrobiaceae bacterium]|nr:Do family serine endopeptidase [Hyphomicrobiaceae bacterium]
MPSWWSAAAAASGVRTTGAARAFIACLLAMSWFAISPVYAQGPVSIAPLAERLGDAVVNISTSQRAKGPSGAPLPHVPRGSPFEDLFEDFFQRKGKKAPGSRRITSLGSGFVIDGKAGLIVTNNHVIADSDEITINFRDGTQLKVDKIVGRDPKTDLALLKVTPKKPLKQVSFGSSDKIRVGDWVLAIGNPFGLGGSVTIGIISAKQRDIHSGPYDDYLQTDAAINKGNSGGPLFNMNGEVIGVNTAIISPGKSGGSIGIGFAIPSSVVVSIIDQLRQFGEIRRGWLGVNIQSVTENLAASLGVPANTGALISKVTKDGPAAKGGIAAGDVIVRFDGKTVENMRALPRIVARTPYGKTVEVEVMRKGKPVKLSILVGRLDEKPASKTGGANKGNQKSGEALKTYSLAGMTVELLGDAQRKAFKLGEKLKGLVVTKVEKGSPAARADIAAGQVIIETNITKALASVNDLADAIETARKANKRNLRVTLDDGKGNVRFVALPLR